MYLSIVNSFKNIVQKPDRIVSIYALMCLTLIWLIHQQKDTISSYLHISRTQRFVDLALSAWLICSFSHNNSTFALYMLNHKSSSTHDKILGWISVLLDFITSMNTRNILWCSSTAQSAQKTRGHYSKGSPPPLSSCGVVDAAVLRHLRPWLTWTCMAQLTTTRFNTHLKMTSRRGLINKWHRPVFPLHRSYVSTLLSWMTFTSSNKERDRTWFSPSICSLLTTSRALVTDSSSYT